MAFNVNVLDVAFGVKVWVSRNDDFFVENAKFADNLSITTMETCFLMFWQPISWLGRAFWFNHVTFSAIENLVPIPNKWPQLFAASCLHRWNCSECAGSNMNILWGAWTVSIRPFDLTLYVIPLVRLGGCKIYFIFLPGVRMIGRLRSTSQWSFSWEWE